MSGSDLHSYYVRSDSGQMVPLDNLAKGYRELGPARHSPITTSSAQSKSMVRPRAANSSGQGLAAMEDVATKTMMPGMKFEWTGLTAGRKSSPVAGRLSSSASAFWSSISLSQRFTRAFALPFIILLAVPMAVLGALGLVSLRGLANDVLLPNWTGHAHRPLGEEFNSDRRVCRAIAQEGDAPSPMQPPRQGELRLRPILMTSFRVYPRRSSAGLRHRCRRSGSPLRRHHRCRRHVALHRPEPVLYPCALCDSEQTAQARNAPTPEPTEA